MKKILRVWLTRENDPSPDLSYFGEYSNSPGPEDRTIDREERGDKGNGEYRYFIAAMSGEETGNPESVEQDYQRMEAYNRGSWNMLGISANAEIVLTGNVVQRVRSGGLWGVETDGGEECLHEVEREELACLKDQLLAVGFFDEEISAAFKEFEWMET